MVDTHGMSLERAQAPTASPSAKADAPSTALRAVPLPRCAREEERCGARANAALYPRHQGKALPLQRGELVLAALARLIRSDHISALARLPRRDP